MDIRSYLFYIWNFWPPFFFSGIRILKKTKDFRHFYVKLKLRFWNANYVGTQYGGSIFSMADPFYMIMLLKNLGKEYIVWDKSSTIHYLKPGKTDLFADFTLSDEDIESIRKTVKEQNGKMEWKRKVEIKDQNGVIVAEVDKTLSIKLKQLPK